MGAAILKIPELALEESEAKKMSDAVNAVLQFYTDAEISPVVQAWLNLAMVGGTIYGPRFVAYNIRSKKDRPKTIPGPVPIAPQAPRSQPQAPPSNVTPFRSESSGTRSDAPKVQPQAHVQAAPLLDLMNWSKWNAANATIGESQ